MLEYTVSGRPHTHTHTLNVDQNVFHPWHFHRLAGENHFIHGTEGTALSVPHVWFLYYIRRAEQHLVSRSDVHKGKSIRQLDYTYARETKQHHHLLLHGMQTLYWTPRSLYISAVDLLSQSSSGLPLTKYDRFPNDMSPLDFTLVVLSPRTRH